MVVVALVLAASVGWLAPGTASADDHPQVAFLSQMVVEMMVRARMGHEGRHIELPKEERTEARPRIDLGVVGLFGRGLDVSSEDAHGSVVLQVRPNFGRRGGLLRCTVRFD